MQDVDGHAETAIVLERTPWTLPLRAARRASMVMLEMPLQNILGGEVLAALVAKAVCGWLMVIAEVLLEADVIFEALWTAIAKPRLFKIVRRA